MDGRKRPWWDYADNLLNSDLHDNLASVLLWKVYEISIGALEAGGELYDRHTKITLPSGYTTAAINGYIITGAYSTNCTISQLWVAGNDVYWAVKNRGSIKTAALTLKLNILLVRSK